jgi:Caspase domain
LKGCKHDVDSIEQFLKDTFEDYSIKRLVDNEATCGMILSTFKEHFTMNEEIGQEDVMLFYYAGHGSRIKAPSGWVTQDGQIEIICPYDQDTEVQMEKKLRRICGIPDHKLNEMLRELSSIKHNNNIVRLSLTGASELPDRIVYLRRSQFSIPAILVGLDVTAKGWGSQETSARSRHDLPYQETLSRMHGL